MEEAQWVFPPTKIKRKKDNPDASTGMPCPALHPTATLPSPPSHPCPSPYCCTWLPQHSHLCTSVVWPLSRQVIDGLSERGGHPVVRMPMKQWMLKITAYADRLLSDLDSVDWADSIKEMQRNWIGRSEVRAKDALEICSYIIIFLNISRALYFACLPLRLGL